MDATLTTYSDRFSVVELNGASAGGTFADDVASGLLARPKRLSSRYFYDEIGSALFDSITCLPEYYLTSAETEILRECGWEIVRSLGGHVEFLELGSGSAVKTRILIEEALRAQGSLHYSPVDISVKALRASASGLVDAYPKLSVRAYAGDYFHVLGSSALRFDPASKALAMFMGSNLGNYEPEAALTLLRLIAAALRPGDGLLLGVDLKKDRSMLELAYDDPAGVTAAFDKNLLARINRELGGTFDLRTFEHVARYDGKRGSVDSYLRSTCDQRVRVEALDLEVALAEGECIHTESSYKFSADEIAKLSKRSGFTLAHSWYDTGERFGVYLLERAA